MKKALFLAIALISLMSNRIHAQWTYVSNTGTTFILYGMSFPPGQSSIGYACGMQYTYDADGVIVKTTDGGNNWTQIWPVSGTIDGLQGIWFTSDLVGYACGWNNYFIKTTNGGSSWTPMNTGADVWYYRDVEFWDANNGIAVGVMNNAGEQAAFITTNAGASWIPASSGLAVGDVMGLSYASQNIVYAVGQSASVYKSVDGGQNWTVSSTLSAMLLGVDFTNTSFAVVGGEEKIFATNNGGSSWSTFVTGYENFYGALALPDGTGYCAGTDENIYKTTDFGQNWVMDYNGSGSSTLYRIRQAADGTVFACGSQGRIMKYSPPLDADFTAVPATVCAGGTVNFSDNSSGTITSWSWTFEGGTPQTSTQQNPVVTYNTPGTYDVQLTVGNGSNYNTELKTDYITVYGALTAPAAPSGPAETCGTYAYQYTTQAVQYANSYGWQVNPASAGTMAGNGLTATFSASNTWSGAYTIKVRAENQCGNGPWSPDFNGALYHDPIMFDLQGTGTYCEGEPGSEITLSDSETGVSYELFKDNITTGMTVAGTGESISFGLFTETGIYSATGYTDHCAENMIGQVYVHMIPAPGQAAVPAGPGNPCNDEISEYITAGAANADTYIWTLQPAEAGILVPDGSSCSVEWYGGYSGTAYLSVTGENACGMGAPSNNLGITVSPAPSPSVSGLDFVCDNTEAEYSTVNNIESSYTWEVAGGAIISGAGTSQIKVLWGNPGTGSVQVTEINDIGCDGTSDEFPVTIDNCIGISEIDPGKVSAYPNPFSEKLHLSGLNDATVRIFSSQGKEVMSIDHLNGNFELNSSELINGLYLVRVDQQENCSVFRMVKQ